MKTICLTLVETPQIEAKARMHFAERGLGDVAFYYGIHAKTAGLATKFTYDVDHPEEHYNIGEHGVGITVSFWSMYRMMMMLPDTHFFTVEHDANFDLDWKPRFEQAMHDVPPDFDFLFIGSCCCQNAPKRHIKGEIWEVKYPMCNHACVIAKKCLPMIIQSCRRVWAPIDIQLAFEVFPKLKVYTMLPRAVGQFDTDLAV